MKRWRCRISGKSAGWIVFYGSMRLRDIFPNEEAAREAADALNRTLRRTCKGYTRSR